MNTRKILNRSVAAMSALAVVGYGAVLWWFHSHENDLIFSPDRVIRTVADSLGLHPARVELLAADGERLVGRMYRASIPDSEALWVLYFHGNARNATSRVGFHAELVKMGMSVMVAEYRGYGESGGKPSEDGVYQDAAAFYVYLRETLRVPASKIVIYGHSLGAAVAIDLASKVPAARVIVEGAFTSLPDIGQEIYPYIPVRWLANAQFASIEKIPRVSAPKLFIHAVDDRTVPIGHGRKLFDAAVGPKMFLEVKGGHDSAYERDRQVFYAGVGAFMALD
jgi:fermentation-respiration switch protein FrsA (DUF1100 family)